MLPASQQRMYDTAVPYEGGMGGFEEREEPVVCGVVPVLTAGYFICSIIVAEGLFLLVNMDAAAEGAVVDIIGMDASNPYHHAQRIVLIVVGFSDIFMALLGWAGLWIAGGQPLEALGGRLLDLPPFGLGVLFAWRFILTVATAPWIGFLTAFESAEYPHAQTLLVTLAFIAVNIYMLWVLAMVRAEVKQRCASLWQQLAEVAAESSALMARAAAERAREEEQQPWRPKIFGCLPLEPVVAAYSLVVCVACAWSFVSLCTTGSNRGGWAILTGSVIHEPGGGRWVEAIVYMVPAVFAGLAVSAILTHTQLDVSEMSSRQRCATLLQLFLVASVLRYAAFIPITVLQLAEVDLCGLYVFGLSHVTGRTPENPLFATAHCRPEELVTLAFVVAFLVLDAYLISGVFRLWQAYREGQLFAGAGKEAFKGYATLG